YFGLCPFHNEKTPSFSVNPSRGFYHCFGCGQGGNAIDFIMGVENLTFGEARAFLAQRLSIPLEQSHSRQRRHGEIDRYQVMEQTATAYQRWLSDCPPAKEYLQKRGLSPEIIRQFSLGYAPNSYSALLENLRRQNIPLELLQELGLVLKSNRGSG